MALGALTLPSVSTGFSSDSKSMVPVSIQGMADKVTKMSPLDTMQEVFFDIRDGIDNLSESIKNQTGLLNNTLLGVITTLTNIGNITKKDLGLEQVQTKIAKEDLDLEKKNIC